MALRPLNSIAGFSTGDPAFTVIQANGDVTTVNLTANGISNLGNVGNVHITGGTTGQYLTTDGLGNLNWDSIGNLSSNRAAVMPYNIPTGQSYIVPENLQGLFSQTITIDGELEVDGILIQIPVAFDAHPTEVLFAENGNPTGRPGFTFDGISGNLAVPGNIAITGDIIPTADDIFDLGNSIRRWRNGYFGGNTIYLDTASISVNNDGYLVFTNEYGGEFIVAGNSISESSTIANGSSQLKVYYDSNIAFSINSTSNVFVVSNTSATLTGNLIATGVKTDNLYYANGSPWDLQQPAGSNTEVQFNNNNDFGASSNFTFNTATNTLGVTGNITLTTGKFTGDIGGASNVVGANVSGAVAYATTANSVAGANVSGTVASATVAATVTTAAQPNITSVGTLTDLAVSGNGTIGGNLVVNGDLVYVNVTELAVEDPIINLNTGANGAPPASNSGKDVGSALNYYDTQARIAFMGWDTSNAEFAFGSQTSISSEIVTFTTLGNVRAQTFKGNIEATTISGSLTTASQANITTVGTLGSLAVTGNITAGNVDGGNTVKGNYLISNSGCVSVNGAMIAFNSGTGAAGIFSSLATDINLGLSANITMGSSSGNVTAQGNLIVNGNISTTSNISGSLITGTLTTSAQPNVTSLGTLTGLTISGNVTSNNAVANTVTTNSTISKRGNIAVTTDTVIDSFPASTYRTAKYVIKSENDDGFESLEVLLIHNNINSFITVYAAINDGGGNTVAITTGISSGNVELRATGLATNTIVNLIGTYVPD